MGHWLSDGPVAEAVDEFIHRFDPVFWTVDFPRPAMAAVTSTAADALRVDTVFYRSNDLVGLIWESVDRHDHPLLRYATDRDYRRCRWSFRWRSAGVLPLDAINGPTLTIEGRDAAGVPRSWYVRLWNYAAGSPEDATVVIDFATLDGGFLLPGEADPVFAGDIDRMFISLVPLGYDAAGGPLAAPVEAWVELSGIACSGSGAVLALADTIVPPHSLEIATGYDDCYHLTPARVLRNALHLGYRGAINHYVGMNHYFRLESAAGGFYISLAGGVLNAASERWHRDFAQRAAALDYEIIWSLSYEILDQHCWNDWKQRAEDGAPALTGWVPPSTLVSPAHAGAIAYLAQVAAVLTQIAVDIGLAPRVQIGEPWWWIMPDGRPCLYDVAARAAFGGAPPSIPSVRGTLSSAQKSLLDAAGDVLAASTATITAAVRAVAPGAETLVLVYLPSVLDPAAPEVRRANLPLGWARPAFDRLQLESYEWTIAGDETAVEREVATAAARLGYPPGEQHFLSGFVPAPEDRAGWSAIEDGARAAQARGVERCFVWALPQVMRDGVVHYDEEGMVQGFDDVSFPLSLGREVEVIAEHSTAIVTSASGSEARNAAWASARSRYDVGPGVRSEADIAALLDFYRARLGPARGFRLRDPFDQHAEGEVIGTGDGVRTSFQLLRRYGTVERPITRPVAGSVRLFVDAVETGAFTLGALGRMAFDAPPAAGATISASFDFDVPVRFAEDRLTVSRATFLAGQAASVPLIEIREA